MIPIVQKATNPPIQVYDRPRNSPNVPMGPFRVCLPRENSTIIKGMDQSSKKMAQGIKNAPPYSPANRGKRQMFPAPMAIPKVERSNVQRELKNSFRSILKSRSCFDP